MARLKTRTMARYFREKKCVIGGVTGSWVGLAEVKKETADVVEVRHTEFVMIPVNGVAKYRCGNIDCARLIPFGCRPNDFNYCPYCGTKNEGV